MPAFTSNQFQWDCGHHSEVKVSPFFLKISDRNGEVDTQDKNSASHQSNLSGDLLKKHVSNFT